MVADRPPITARCARCARSARDLAGLRGGAAKPPRHTAPIGGKMHRAAATMQPRYAAAALTPPIGQTRRAAGQRRRADRGYDSVAYAARGWRPNTNITPTYRSATLFRRHPQPPRPLRAGGWGCRRGWRVSKWHYVEFPQPRAAAGGVVCSVAAGAASYRWRRAGARCYCRSSTFARPPCVLGMPSASLRARARRTCRNTPAVKPLRSSC